MDEDMRGKDVENEKSNHQQMFQCKLIKSAFSKTNHMGLLQDITAKNVCYGDRSRFPINETSRIRQKREIGGFHSLIK